MSSKAAARLAALDASLAKGHDKSAAERRAEALLAASSAGRQADSTAGAIEPTPITGAAPAAPVRKLGVQDIPLEKVHDNPFDARRVRREADVLNLADSFKIHGQQTPARGYWKPDGTVGLFYGHVRKRAAIHLGWPSLKVDMVAPPQNDQELYLVSRSENVDRAEQTPLDDALAWLDLLEKRVYSTQDELAAAVGLQQSTIAKTLSFAKLPMQLMDECIKHGIVNTTMLYALVQYHKEAGSIDKTSDLIKQIKDGGLSTREVDALTKRLKLEREAGGPTVVRKPRSDIHKIVYAGARGELKEFAEKGRVVLTIDLNDDAARAQLMTQLKSLFTTQ